ncbi:MAG: hypothetical protein J6R27_00560 [Muribaculaceae bacterium]|nr:hypothetical protein [Muribaculaceae bacterium]
MINQRHSTINLSIRQCCRTIVLAVAAMVLMPFNLFSVSLSVVNDEVADSIQSIALQGEEIVVESITALGDRVKFQPLDTIPAVEAVAALDSVAPTEEDEWVRREIEFNPDPTRAVWMAALFPGLGQLYNRRYWKLPIVVGGYLGLAYATNWNSTMLTDYTNAYADITDNDPTTNSYMDLFPSNVKEESLDKAWLTKVLQSRKKYFKRNRDLCIISMVGVYLLAIVDAYVDAQLAHFDITPDLTMDVYPSLIQDGRNTLPSVGMQWALNF